MRAVKAHTEYLTLHTDRLRELVHLTPRLAQILARSGVSEGFMLVSAMHITAGVFINDDESGLHADIWEWLEKLAPFRREYRHHETGETNGDAHLKSLLVHHEVIVPITAGPPGPGAVAAGVLRRVRRATRQAIDRQGDGRVRSGSLLPYALLATACGAPATSVVAPAATPTVPPDDGRAATSSFAQAEVEALGWASAADPRLAIRTGVMAPPDVVGRLGTIAVLAEDTTARMRGGSLDLFAFKARAAALAEAGKTVAAFRGDLPERGPVGSELRRPRLERELLVRLLDEESTRAADEARLGETAGDLVRAIVATWTPPASPQDVQDRDVWVAKHLLEIRESLRDTAPRTGPPDLDVALYPLERLLASTQYPRGTAALAQLRIALDQDLRVAPAIDSAERTARAVRVHLGLTLDLAALPAQFASLEALLRTEAEHGLTPLDDAGRRATLGRARELLYVEGACPQVVDSPVRSMQPPPERTMVCGLLRALSEAATQLAAIIALHDEVQLSLAAVTSAPPPRTSLLCEPANEDVDSLRRMARERPVVALGPVLAARIAIGRGVSDARIAAWRDLGDVPLDVLERELGGP